MQLQSCLLLHDEKKMACHELTVYSEHLNSAFKCLAEKHFKGGALLKEVSNHRSKQKKSPLVSPGIITSVANCL